MLKASIDDMICLKAENAHLKDVVEKATFDKKH